MQTAKFCCSGKPHSPNFSFPVSISIISPCKVLLVTLLQYLLFLETASANTSPSVLKNRSKVADSFNELDENCEMLNTSPSVKCGNTPVLKCRYSRCGRLTSALATERLAVKNCHNCSYTYCSRACRRAHWEKHRKTCLFSRVGTLCRQILSTAKEQEDTLVHLSTIARRGYLSQGRGAVKCFFPCPETAEKFLSHGLEYLNEPTYITWRDLLPSEMGPQLYTELVKMCKTYNPETKLVLYVSICVVSEAPTLGAVKWERQLVSRCAKMTISKGLLMSHMDKGDLETLILMCSPIKGADKEVLRYRKMAFNSIQRHLKRRGIILQQHYLQIYKDLQTYTENPAERFIPVTVHPRDSFTGKSFICIIMLDAESQNIHQMTTAGVLISVVNILEDY